LHICHIKLTHNRDDRYSNSGHDFKPNKFVSFATLYGYGNKVFFGGAKEVKNLITHYGGNQQQTFGPVNQRYDH